MFQSRNRDAFRFKSTATKYSHPDSVSFNLGIEMLFVSSETEWERNYHTHWHSFNLGIEMLFVSSPYRRPCRPPPRMVSISESRCFSFQVRRHAPDVVPPRFSFQSRNRDAFRFKSSRNLFKKPKVDVSISESRCFSFQVKSVRRRRKEVVIVSISESRCFSFQVTVMSILTSGLRMFQSRNRDAFRFK